MQKKTILGAVLASGFVLGLASPAFAEGDVPPEEKAKCNSGRGNGSEVAGADCDPGNSGGHNNGGDN